MDIEFIKDFLLKLQLTDNKKTNEYYWITIFNQYNNFIMKNKIKEKDIVEFLTKIKFKETSLYLYIINNIKQLDIFKDFDVNINLLKISVKCQEYDIFTISMLTNEYVFNNKKFENIEISKKSYEIENELRNHGYKQFYFNKNISKMKYY